MIQSLSNVLLLDMNLCDVLDSKDCLIQTPVLPLNNYVIMDKLVNYLVPQFLHLQNGKLSISWDCLEDSMNL